MQHIWSVLCRSSQIDRDTNNLSINNVFEQLIVTLDQQGLEKTSGTINIPPIPIEYEFVSFWVKEDKKKKIKAEITLDIIDPKGSLLKSFTQTGEMPESMRRLRTRFRIQGLGLTISGIYKFIVKIKEEKRKDFRAVSEVPLEVHLINKLQNKSTKN